MQGDSRCQRKLPCCGETSTSLYQPWRSLDVFQQSRHEPTVTPATISHSFPTVERISHSEGKPKSSRWPARPYVSSSQHFHFSHLNMLFGLQPHSGFLAASQTYQAMVPQGHCTGCVLSWQCSWPTPSRPQASFLTTPCRHPLTLLSVSP